MKKRSYLVALLIVSISGITVFANDIKVHINESVKYISIEEFVEGLNGTITSEGEKSIVEISYNTLEVENGYSFIKKNDEYVPVDTEVIDGYVVPKDSKVYEEGSDTFLPLNFIEENIVGDYSILEDKVVFESSEVEDEIDEEEVDQEEDDYTPPTRPGGGTTNPGSGSSGGTSPGGGGINPGEGDDESDEDTENPGDGNDGSDGNIENPGDGSDGSDGDSGNSGDGSDGSDGNSGNPGDGNNGSDGNSGNGNEGSEGDSGEAEV